VPNGEQRIWRSMTRMKLQLTRDRVRLQNHIECLLEEMRIKLSRSSAIYWGPAACAFCMLWQSPLQDQIPTIKSDQCAISS
jgi:hypothetical protein